MYNKLKQAASIRIMGTDSLSGLQRIENELKRLCDQVRVGLITESEAIYLAKTN